MNTDPLRIDWHCHSTWSDGRATVPQIVEQARRRGMTIGIADHALSDNRRLCGQEQIDSYLADLQRYPVLRGAEISIGDLGQPGWPAAARKPAPPTPQPPPELSTPPSAGAGADASGVNEPGDPSVNLDACDYVIASLHSVYIPEGRVHATRYHNYRAGLYPGYKRSLEKYQRRAFFETWLTALDATARRWPVTILGHFCLLPELARADATYVLEEDPVPDQEAADFVDATIQLCVRHNSALEINSKSRVPHAFFLKRALELGARFSLGSDAHRLSAAGDVTYSRQLASRIGIPRDRFLRLRDVRPDLDASEDAAG